MVSLNRLLNFALSSRAKRPMRADAEGFDRVREGHIACGVGAWACEDHRRGVLATSSQRSLRRRAEHPRHSNDVAGRHRQLEVLIDAADASIQWRSAWSAVGVGRRASRPLRRAQNTTRQCAGGGRACCGTPRHRRACARCLPGCAMRCAPTAAAGAAADAGAASARRPRCALLSWRALAKHIAVARFIALAGSSHWWWMDDADRVVGEVTAFMEATPPSASHAVA
jgi:hypothetical protein